jgi:hypothetical protein
VLSAVLGVVSIYGIVGSVWILGGGGMMSLLVEQAEACFGFPLGSTGCLFDLGI